MLRLPTLRGQCLFCSFRTLAATLSKKSPHGRPRFSTSASQNRELPKPSPPRHVLRGGKKVTLARSRRLPARKTVELSEEAISARIRLCLTVLKKRLSGTKVSEDSDLTQLAALDPNGTCWPSFHDRLTENLRDLTGAQGPDEDRLFAEIGRIQESDDWRKELVRVLHFGFIDHVLFKRAEEDPGHGSLLDDLRFPTEWYLRARQTQRDVHLHIGPTNSGKTYNALKRLEESGNGFYAGPLRLLAHEVYSRFKAKGVPCDLITGDDVRLDDNPNVTLSASTVEMAPIGDRFEVAVIDEIQMMASEDRGWAWTRAFLGANAKEVHLCGEARVLPLVRELTASTGDILHVHEYQRLNPLKVMSKSLRGDLKSLRKGDCVVTFSVMNIHALKKQIELDTGRHCAIVYGGLPPEVRAQQAALFNDPNNDYDFLVASDAIGMGLNLSVKRIIFHSITKFDGSRMTLLSTAQIKQIGGRAGRYRSAHQAMNDVQSNSESNVGLVTTLNELDLPIVRDAMNMEAAPMKWAGILPPAELFEELERRLPKGIPFEYILRRLCERSQMHHRFRVCSIRDQTRIARAIESVSGLSVTQQIILTASPGSVQSPSVSSVIKALAECVAARKSVSIVDVPEIKLEMLEEPISGDQKYLQNLEDLHKSLILFLWLSYRFQSIFKDRPMAVYAKEMAEARVNTCLTEFSANPELRKRVLAYKKRMATTARPSDGEFVTVTAPELDVQGAQQDSTLPVAWTRGTSDVELDESPPPQPAVAAHA